MGETRGMVVIAIIAALTDILMPGLARAKDQARNDVPIQPATIWRGRTPVL